ncbi:MAG TPA: ATP-binding protein [Methanobacterium sp.]|nr:ATP-binding protein [Methanobacterium sp.]
MTDYNPFDKRISEIEEDDLNNLIDKVAEGWYIEYKGDFPNSKKIAHSIASFANTDGGWYIIGIDSDEATNIAERINPFDLNEHRSPKDKIRNIVTNGINPKPFFESKLVHISDDKAVLIVHIERGGETPYVTNDGRIYERVGEGSDPIPIKDHYTILKLFERSKENKALIENFSKNLFLKSLEQNSEQTFLEVYFYIPPTYGFKFENFYSDEFFNEIRENFSTDVKILEELESTFNLNCDNYYSSISSYIIRNINIPDNYIHLGLTLELFENGNLKVLIPTHNLEPGMSETQVGAAYYLESAIYSRFQELISNITDSVRVIDCYLLFLLIIVINNLHCRILKSHNFNGQLNVRIKISNCNRIMPYFDSEKYIEHILSNGFPICLKPSIEIPEFNNGNALNISLNYQSGVNLGVKVIETLGLPFNLNMAEILSSIGDYLLSLNENHDPE